MKLKNKITIVTGAASGIGRAIALRLASEGAVVVLADVDEKGAQETLSLMSGTGIFIKTDVRTEGEVEDLVKTTIEKHGQLDVLVNSVGIYSQNEGDVADMQEKDFAEVMDTNFKSVFLTTKHALPHLVESKGNIVNVSSALGFVPEAESPAYCSSKAAINMFTRVTALNYAERNVRVNAVCPGPIDTPLLRRSFPTDTEMTDYLQHNPMKRAGTAEEVANVVLFLASDDASYVTGGLYTIDGGESLT